MLSAVDDIMEGPRGRAVASGRRVKALHQRSGGHNIQSATARTPARVAFRLERGRPFDDGRREQSTPRRRGIGSSVHGRTTWRCLGHHNRVMRAQNHQQEKHKRPGHPLSNQHGWVIPSSGQGQPLCGGHSPGAPLPPPAAGPLPYTEVPYDPFPPSITAPGRAGRLYSPRAGC